MVEAGGRAGLTGWGWRHSDGLLRGRLQSVSLLDEGEESTKIEGGGGGVRRRQAVLQTNELGMRDVQISA